MISDASMTILKDRYFLRDKEGKIIEDWAGLCRRVAKAAANCEKDKKNWEEKFYTMLINRDFLPNSPTLMNAGTEKMKSLSACFVVPIEDDMGSEDSKDSITDAFKNSALIGREGGGVGFSFGQLRPKGDIVKSTSGESSGPISFMKVIDAVAEAVKQGGRRRIALMGILPVDHPDIMEFIVCKGVEGEISNFNISIAITDKFMKAWEEGEKYDLVNPKDGSVVKQLDAKTVFREICRGAWTNGEPGIIFIDEINRMHNLSDKIISTNPCGEQPLLSYESCCLGSINVANFYIYNNGDVKENDSSFFDIDKFLEIIRVATRFLDNIITIQKSPLRKIDEVSKHNRKIGLGIMGFADLLIKMDIPYGSDESFQLANNISKTLKETAFDESCNLAEEKGTYLKHKKEGGNFSEKIIKDNRVPRNACQISMAPTGTIASIADASFGIEPLYDIVFVKNILDNKKVVMVNSVVNEFLTRHGYGDQIDKIENGVDALDIPKELKDILVTTYNLTPEQHVVMQAEFQKNVDSSISKTINFPNDATINDIRKAYLLAYELKCKGITVYRDGSRIQQVVETKKDKNKVAIQRPDVVTGSTYKINTGLGKLYIVVNRVDDQPVEVFLEMSDISNDMKSLLDTIARMISLSFQHGTPIKNVIKSLKKNSIGTPVIYNSKSYKSIPQLIGKILEDIFVKGDVEQLFRICDKCGSKMIFQEGCEKCTNPECGFSRC